MDKISNLIINIKNAGGARNEYASVPYSQYKMSIAKLLKKDGFLTSVESKGKKVKRTIQMGIVYNEEGKPKLQNVIRVSKPSKRVYLGAKEVYSVKGGTGILVLSTPKGILTDKMARKEKVGGEALFKIW